MTEEEISKLPAIIGVKEVCIILNIGKSTAYKLVKRDDFPKLPIDMPYRFSKQEVLKWAKVNL